MYIRNVLCRTLSTIEGVGKMTVLARKKINFARYGRMISRVRPVVIKNERENERMLTEIWKLMSKGEENLSSEENALLELMSKLV